jgi:hypothetical protein
MSKLMTPLVVLILSASVAHAASLTTASCLAQKQRAWGQLRACEAGEKAKLLLSRPADLAKCQTDFDDKLARISAVAADASVACRYLDNGDATVTDYDTGLQWEQKVNDNTRDVVHHVETIFSWCERYGFESSCPHNVLPSTSGTAFVWLLGRLNSGWTFTASQTSGCFAGHCDWRLPLIEELAGIFDATQAGCGDGSSPCIDPVFGPTRATNYWSATTFNQFHPSTAYVVHFGGGGVGESHVTNHNLARAVRSAF